MGKWGSGEMGKWGGGEMGRGSGEVGKWGNGEIELKPQNPKTPTPKTCLGVS
ncbi:MULTISPECIES: hypothetical protein [unclassified Microcystis]|uniref:hypothetical protein n=1 Tax=unclassified Microcystis TaxID=2643300 RepID=UPI0025900771|nr:MULTISPECIES: hypothetical protein [unclassified Microcystis]MCA2505940.1 hypothetical protein [Microcystis sp. M62BS1]